ncbi:MAG: 4-hydroxy-3-methylbut-2-enyl diphosphate reductase [Clostridia bacterium]|nr:4-hydroxy-3-methylbut-2-enyl diphosphate reductase [Clostridia bacterium]
MADRIEVTVAKSSGFCSGVARAAKYVEKEIARAESGERIFTLGRLIHNDTYNARLAAQGVGIISPDEIENIAATATEGSPVKVFVRAHGIERSTEEKLVRCSEKNPHFTFVDCTCVYVKKIHKIVEENNDKNGTLLVLGSREHPEVVGFCSRFDGNVFVFDKCEQLEEALKNGLLSTNCAKAPILVAQTTQKLGEWEKTKQFLKKVYTNSQIFDTICSVTECRQIEAAKLSRISDFMIVIGSRGSSNSAKLYSICKAECDNTVMIENADEMKQYFPFTHKKVGIVAGASTPHDIIQEVERTMSKATENFAELLETSLRPLNTGDTVTGYVTAVNDSELQLDLGAKVTGIIKADKITDDPAAKLTEMFKIGDAVEAFVVRVSDVEGFATLDKKRVDSDKNWSRIVAAKENDEILEGTVVEVVKGGVGVVVVVDANRIFVHASQTGLSKDADLATMVGQKVRLKVTEIRDGKRAKGSISVILREERRKAEAEFWANIEEGKQYTGKVKSMTSYGAFVDLGGVDGMVHASELSWKRVKSPADVVAIGDEITVTVKSVDKEKKRISLTYKTEETNPWTIFKTNYAVGDIVAVKIVSMMPFGAFAEIVDGVDGLIHISQIAMTKIAKPADVLEVGQTVDAKIVEVDDEKKKVSLSIRALLEEAQALAEAMPEDEAAVEAVEEAADAE